MIYFSMLLMAIGGFLSLAVPFMTFQEPPTESERNKLAKKKKQIVTIVQYFWLAGVGSFLLYIIVKNIVC